jgi:hypothetical protein
MLDSMLSCDMLRHDMASGISRFSDFRLLSAIQPHLTSSSTSLHFVDFNSTSIFTHLYDTEHVRVFFEMVTEEAFVTKKTSKLIEQTIGIRLAMETIRANNLALSNKWPRQHALPCQQPQHLFSFQDMRRFILSFLTSTQSIYTLTQ